LTVPQRRVQIEVTKGLEYQVATQDVICGQETRVVVRLRPLQVPKEEKTHWSRAGLHVHMNYGGT